MATKKERHPYAYTVGEEDPRTRKRTVPLEVISAGFSRTGTMTMMTALEILGYPTWHNVIMGANPPDIDMWSDAMLAKYDPEAAAAKGITKPFGREAFDQLLGYWAACTDQPACCFTDDLVRLYPESKVILVERDIEKWHKSFCDAVVGGCSNPWIPLAKLIDPVYMKRMCDYTDLHMKHYFNVSLPRQHLLTNNQAGLQMYADNAKAVYRKHNEMVRKVTPVERLLVFKLEDGWEPLCSFLNRPIPEVPFPRVNETKAAQEMVQVYVANSYKRALANFAKRAMPVLVVVTATVMWWKLYH